MNIFRADIFKDMRFQGHNIFNNARIVFFKSLLESTRCFKRMTDLSSMICSSTSFFKRTMSRRGHDFSLQSTGLELVFGVWLRTVRVSLFVKCGIPICCCNDHFQVAFRKHRQTLKGRRFSSGRFCKAIMVDQRCGEQIHFQVHARAFVVFEAPPHSRRSHFT